MQTTCCACQLAFLLQRIHALQQPAQTQHSKMGRRLAQPVAAIVQPALLGQMTELLPAPLLRSRTHFGNCEATQTALHVQLEASARRRKKNRRTPIAAGRTIATHPQCQPRNAGRADARSDNKSRRTACHTSRSTACHCGMQSVFAWCRDYQDPHSLQPLSLGR
jgi:hypothetical protein